MPRPCREWHDGVDLYATVWGSRADAARSAQEVTRKVRAGPDFHDGSLSFVEVVSGTRPGQANRARAVVVLADIFHTKILNGSRWNGGLADVDVHPEGTAVCEANEVGRLLPLDFDWFGDLDIFVDVDELVERQSPER